MKDNTPCLNEILSTLRRIEEELILFNERMAIVHPLTQRKSRTVTTRENIVLPWNTEEFVQAWDFWREYKKKSFKFVYRTAHSEEQALLMLNRLAKGDETKAIAIIQQSVANQWQGFFEIKQNGKSDTDLFDGVSYK